MSEATNPSGTEDRALFVVAVMLQRNEATSSTLSQTMSWAFGTREEVIGRAIEFATKQKPDFNILQYVVGEIKGDESPATPIQAEG